MSEARKCPKCGGEMEQGYLDGAAWCKGEPFHIGSGKIIYVYRCENCGFAELYVTK